MSVRIKLEADINDAYRDGDVTYYPVSQEFRASCINAGDALIIEACITTGLYDEELCNYPISRIRWSERDGIPSVGFVREL